MRGAARARRRRAERTAHAVRNLVAQADDNVSVLVAWCDGPDMLEEAKTASHDALIGPMGDRRTGGVTWNIYEPLAAFRVLDRMIGHERSLRDQRTQPLIAHYRKVRDLLRLHRGLMVVAMAPGVPPES